MKNLDFDIIEGDYRLTAEDDPMDKRNSIIKIYKKEKLIKTMNWPAYKIWNIPAHAKDIVEGLESENDSGLKMAGNNGLGGNVYRESKNQLDRE